MPPLTIAVAGLSGAGKTSLLERLVPRLRADGLRVAYLKANAHRIDLDREGKDTERLRRAGAAAAGIVSRDDSAFFPGPPLGIRQELALVDRASSHGARREDVDPDHWIQRSTVVADSLADERTRFLLWNLLPHFAECDLLLIEGMKSSPLPKILVNRVDNPRGILNPAALRNVVVHLEWPTLPTDWTESVHDAQEFLHSALAAPVRTHARGVLGAVLAGGAASCMMMDEARISLGPGTSHDLRTAGKRAEAGYGTLLERAYLLLAERCEETWVIGRVSRPRSADLPSLHRPVLSHLDLRTSAGPLAGMETALAVADGRAVLTIPCSLPLFPPQAVDRLLEERRADMSAVAYRREDGTSVPAVLLLEARCREPLRRYLDAGGREPGEFLQTIHTRWLPVPQSWGAESESAETRGDGLGERTGEAAGSDR